MHAYRAWATADPQRFLLIFGTPIPGYAAPEDGPTEQANRRIGAAFFGVAADAHAASQLIEADPGRPLTPTEQAAAT